MSGWSSSIGLSRIHSGARDVLILPRKGAGGRRGVVMCHGFGGNAARYAGVGPYQTQLAQRLASAGLAVCAIDFGDSFGNADAALRVEESRLRLVANGCASDKVLIAGLSMGHFTACSYQRVYPGKTAAIVGLSPGTDLNYARDGDVLGSRSSIDAAWGVTYPAPLPAGADPITDPATHAGIPRRLYSSTGDTIALWSSILAFASAVSGTTAIPTTNTATHGDESMVALPFDEVIAFMLEYSL